MSLPVMTIDGDVVAVHSFWTDDRSRIVTEATVRTPDGDVVVSQLGGSVDGIGMIQMGGPPILEPGMKVAVAAHRGLDRSLREHIVLDTVKVLAYPAGFVRTGPTKAGNYLHWESGCVFVTIDAAGTAAIPGDQEFPVIDAAIATWNNDTASCSYLEVKSDGKKSGLEVGRDNINLIKIRDTPCASCGGSWCRPASGNDPERCNAASAAGLTTAVYIDDATSKRDGAILDADIEINGVDFAVSLDGTTTGGRPCMAELQNTLTHELGHLHGLEHPCRAGMDPARVDDQGRDVPLCALTTDPAIVDATMYNFQECGETKKETLSQDDVNAICQIYPKAKDPGECGRVGEDSGGCSTSQPDASLVVAATALLLLLGRRRSQRT